MSKIVKLPDYFESHDETASGIYQKTRYAGRVNVDDVAQYFVQSSGRMTYELILTLRSGGLFRFNPGLDDPKSDTFTKALAELDELFGVE